MLEIPCKTCDKPQWSAGRGCSTCSLCEEIVEYRGFMRLYWPFGRECEG
jgi:hypothetical protein